MGTKVVDDNTLEIYVSVTRDANPELFERLSGIGKRFRAQRVKGLAERGLFVGMSTSTSVPGSDPVDTKVSSPKKKSPPQKTDASQGSEGDGVPEGAVAQLGTMLSGVTFD